MADDLSDLRQQINELDERLLQLLNKRAAIALQIGGTKATTGKPVYDPAREQLVLERIAALNRGPLGQSEIETLFRTIITTCREIQNK